MVDIFYNEFEIYAYNSEDEKPKGTNNDLEILLHLSATNTFNTLF